MSGATAFTEAAAADFAQLADEIRVARNTADSRKQAGPGRFNVFTTLLKAQDEVKLHTRFLHCLLNPKGSHDCKDLFLRLFFETLKQQGVLNHESREEAIDLPPAGTQWTAKKEDPRPPFGRLDLLLEHGISFAVAIENKIDHHEGEEQLARYARALEEGFPGSWLLLYLTVDGKRGESAGKASYLRISYSGHILAWLEKCLQETRDKPALHSALLQYRDVVMQLCGLALDHKDMKPIVEFIRENPDIIRFRAEITKAAQEAVLQAWDRIEEGIKANLSPKYMVTSSPGTDGRFGEGIDQGLVIIPPEGSALRNAPFEIWVERDNQDFSVGACVDSKTVSHTDADKRWIAELVENAPRDADPNVRYPLGWKKLIAGADDEHFADWVKDPDIGSICSRIEDYIGQLESAFESIRGRSRPAD